MGTIIDKLNRQKELLRSIGETLYFKKNGSSSDNVEGFSNLKEISENLDNFRYLEPYSSSCSASAMRKGSTAYDSFGSLITGTFQPYSGITASAADVVTGKYFRDSNGLLTLGTHECVSSSEKPYTCTIRNNSTSYRIIKKFNQGTTTGQYRLIPEYCEPGESFDIKIDWGDVFVLILVSNTSGYPKVTNNAPFENFSSSYMQINTNLKQIIFGVEINKFIVSQTYVYYYPADNTSMTITG